MYCNEYFSFYKKAISDGVDTVRNLQTYPHPQGEHLLDRFHITMRLTVMNQQTKAVIVDDETIGADIEKSIESVKYYLWHGNVDTASERLDTLSFSLETNRRRSKAIIKLLGNLTDFDTYIRNKREFLPNFG